MVENLFLYIEGLPG